MPALQPSGPYCHVSVQPPHPHEQLVASEAGFQSGAPEVCFRFSPSAVLSFFQFVLVALESRAPRESVGVGARLAVFSPAPVWSPSPHLPPAPLPSPAPPPPAPAPPPTLPFNDIARFGCFFSLLNRHSGVRVSECSGGRPPRWLPRRGRSHGNAKHRRPL